MAAHRNPLRHTVTPHPSYEDDDDDIFIYADSDLDPTDYDGMINAYHAHWEAHGAPPANQFHIQEEPPNQAQIDNNADIIYLPHHPLHEDPTHPSPPDVPEDPSPQPLQVLPPLPPPLPPPPPPPFQPVKPHYPFDPHLADKLLDESFVPTEHEWNYLQTTWNEFIGVVQSSPSRIRFDVGDLSHMEADINLAIGVDFVLPSAPVPPASTPENPPIPPESSTIRTSLPPLVIRDNPLPRPSSITMEDAKNKGKAKVHEQDLSDSSDNEYSSGGLHLRSWVFLHECGTSKRSKTPPSSPILHGLDDTSSPNQLSGNKRSSQLLNMSKSE